MSLGVPSCMLYLFTKVVNHIDATMVFLVFSLMKYFCFDDDHGVFSFKICFCM